MLQRIRKAQSTLEYALLIGVVVASLLSMQNYLKRAIQGRMQIIGDQMGDQYSPGLTHRQENMMVSHGKIQETMVGGISPSVTTVISGGRHEMNSYRDVRPLNEETWGTGNQETNQTTGAGE
jgi:hypothetical protein